MAKFKNEEKINAVLRYINGNESLLGIANHIGVHKNGTPILGEKISISR